MAVAGIVVVAAAEGIVAAGTEAEPVAAVVAGTVVEVEAVVEAVGTVVVEEA